MSARRTKKQQRQFEEGIKGLLGLIAIAAFIFSESIKVTLVVVGISIVIILYIFYLQAKKRNDRLRKSGIEEIDSMDGIRFENYLVQLFHSLGYKAEVTSASGDYGADLVLNMGDRKIVVQAKRYNSNVGIKAVQEVRSALDYYKANEAWVVTNSFFTKQAEKQAGTSNVVLVDREMLIDMILEMNPGAMPKPKVLNIISNKKSITCERCGNKMVLRNGKKGQFYGCSGFPKCRNTKGIEEVG